MERRTEWEGDDVVAAAAGHTAAGWVEASRMGGSRI
jgi:hypothetical protein